MEEFRIIKPNGEEVTPEKLDKLIEESIKNGRKVRSKRNHKSKATKLEPSEDEPKWSKRVAIRLFSKKDC